MNLVKEKWTKSDIKPFNEYLLSFENKEKQVWAKNLLRTDMKVLALKTQTMKDITKEIFKGNYLSFLDLNIWEYYENTPINGSLISKIKDFDTYKHYLDIYSEQADNWATCDLLTFNVKGQEEKFYLLAKEYIKSPKPFKRRIGINVLFNLINYEDYIDKIFQILNTFTNEEEYYVNMINAWLVCECFIKQREKNIRIFKKS